MTVEELEKAKALKEKSWYKEKYLNSLKTVTRTRLKKQIREFPERELKDHLSLLLGKMPAEAPSKLLLLVTKFIIEEWEKMGRQEAVAV